jgi:transposase
MVSQETRIMIRRYVRQGEPISTVARRFGVSRQTVYNHLNEPGKQAAESSVRCLKLDPHKDYLRSRLEQFDLPATVLLRELREQGFAEPLRFSRSSFARSRPRS